MGYLEMLNEIIEEIIKQVLEGKPFLEVIEQAKEILKGEIGFVKCRF